MRRHLVEAADACGAVVAAIGAEDWQRRTPCAEWTVRELLNHVVATTTKFSDFAAGLTDAPRPPAGDVLGDDPAAAYDAARVRSADAWRTADLGRTCRMSFRTFSASEAAAVNAFDLIVHAWDLARAVGAAVPSASDALLDVATAVARRLVTPDAIDAGCYAPPPGTPGTGGWDALLLLTGRCPTP